MGSALEKFLPNSSDSPTFGGTSFWVRGPKSLDAEILAEKAAARGILIEPGRVTYGAPNAPKNFFRLAFSSIDEGKIEPGIRLLSEVMKEQ